MTLLETSVEPEPTGANRPARAGSPRRPRRRLGPFHVSAWALTAALALVVLTPLVVMGKRLLWQDGSFNTAVVSDTFALNGFGRLLFNTLFLVVVGGIVATIIGSVLAWIATQTDAKMPVVTGVLPMLPFFLPPIAGAAGWVLLASPGAGYLNALLRWLLGMIGIDVDSGPINIFSWWGLIGIFSIYQVPLVFMLVSSGLANIHSSLAEQSRVCSAGRLQTFWRITLPSLKPSLGAAMILMTWSGFAFFSVPFIIGRQAGIEVLSVRLVELMTFTYPPKLNEVLGITTIITALVAVTWLMQVRILKQRRFSAIGGQGMESTMVRLGRWKWPLRLVVIGYGFVAVVLPLLALVLVTLQGFWSAKVRWAQLNLDTFKQTIFEDRFTQDAIQNSLKLAIIGATVGMLLAVVASWVIANSRGGATRAVDGVLKLPATVPNLVLAVGILIAFTGAPLHLEGTLLILLVGYVVAYLPSGSVAADAAFSQVGPELVEASRVEGAGPGATFRRIELPLMVPGLVVGWAFLFARMAGDLQVSAILAGAGNQVVGSRLLEISNGGSYAALASLALVIVVITGVVVAVVMRASKLLRRWEG